MGRAQETELILRREGLLVRSAELRIRLAHQSRVLGPPLAVVDQTMAFGQWLRRNPLWPLGALFAWIVLRPRRAIRWAGRMGAIWQLAKRARRLLTLLRLPGF